MSYLSVHADTIRPRFTRHVWRSGDGRVNGTVELSDTAGGRIWLCFDDPAHADALAAECSRAAEAMRQFGAEHPDGGAAPVAARED